MKLRLNKLGLSLGLMTLFSATASAQIMVGGIPNAASPDLQGWWDASDASTFTFVSGNQVNTWTDKSSAGVVATIDGGTSITRDPYINGSSAVNTTGANFFTLGSTVSLSIGAAGDASAFVVASTTDSSGGDTLMSFGGQNRQFFRQNNAEVRFYKGTNPDAIVNGDALTADRIRYAAFGDGTAGSGLTQYDIDGVGGTIADGGTLNNNNWDLNRIGGGGGCCGNWNGTIAEILLFDRALTAQEQNDVGYYLENKYGIATTYVPEPSSLGLLALGAIGIVMRRRR